MFDERNQFWIESFTTSYSLRMYQTYLGELQNIIIAFVVTTKDKMRIGGIQ